MLSGWISVSAARPARPAAKSTLTFAWIKPSHKHPSLEVALTTSGRSSRVTVDGAITHRLERHSRLEDHPDVEYKPHRLVLPHDKTAYITIDTVMSRKRDLHGTKFRAHVESLGRGDDIQKPLLPTDRVATNVVVAGSNDNMGPFLGLRRFGLFAELRVSDADDDFDHVMLWYGVNQLQRIDHVQDLGVGEFLSVFDPARGEFFRPFDTLRITFANSPL
jgi:hypothetical protein